MIFLKKRWIIAGAVLLICAAALLPQLAADTHLLLLREPGSVTLHPAVGWRVILADSRALKLYVLYVLVTAVVLLWTLVGGNYLRYRSDTQRITPEIVTPCPAGQGQYGTARWLTKEKLGRCFGVWRVPEKQDWYQELMEAGKASCKEVERANVHVD